MSFSQVTFPFSHSRIPQQKFYEVRRANRCGTEKTLKIVLLLKKQILNPKGDKNTGGHVRRNLEIQNAAIREKTIRNRYPSFLFHATSGRNKAMPSGQRGTLSWTCFFPLVRFVRAKLARNHRTNCAGMPLTPQRLNQRNVNCSNWSSFWKTARTYKCPEQCLVFSLLYNLHRRTERYRGYPAVVLPE